MTIDGEPEATFFQQLAAVNKILEEANRVYPDPDGEPTCSVCRKAASEIDSIVLRAEDEGMSAAEYACEDGTYNVVNNRFVCDADYVAIGMPSSADGWKAP